MNGGGREQGERLTSYSHMRRRQLGQQMPSLLKTTCKKKKL